MTHRSALLLALVALATPQATLAGPRAALPAPQAKLPTPQATLAGPRPGGPSDGAGVLEGGDVPDLRLAYARGPIDDAPTKRAWSWPSEERFRGAWDGFEAASAYVIVDGQVAGQRGSWVVDARDGLLRGDSLGGALGGFTAPIGSGPPPPGALWAVQGLGGPLAIDHVSSPSAPTGAARLARAYLHALSQSERSVAVEPSWDHSSPDPATAALWSRLDDLVGADDPGVAELLPALLAHPVGSDDFRWQSAATLAEARQDWDLAVRFRARYRPMGQCSMDTAPEEAMRDHARTCQLAGDTGCFVRLTVLAMDYWSSPRFAWSSYGEAAAATGSELLAAPGIDVPRILFGAVFRWQGEPEGVPSVPPRRLARAISEAGLEAPLTASLRDAVGDGALDDYNRLRAAWVLGLLVTLNGQDPDVLVAAFDGIALPPVVAGWLDRSAAELRAPRK